MAQIGDNPTFTTTEAVRGALGIDATDLKDQQILDAALDVEMGLELATWLTNWKDKLAPADPATEDQERLQAALQSYCKWWCAAEQARKILSFVQLYGDGKAEMRRFTNFDWETVIGNAQGKAEYFKAMVQQLDPTGVIVVTTDSYGLISGGIPTHDPVTNEGAR